MTTLHLGKSIGQPPVHLGFIFIPLLFAYFGLLPVAQAVSPAPDGGYPGGNTAEGTDALLNLTSGIWNTAVGFEALNHDTAGKTNTASGVRALSSNTSGSYNSATGVYALYANINGWYNNAVGAYALTNNISGNYNTANGYSALYRNTASYNTATGFGALHSNTTGELNTGIGEFALFSNTSGYDNTANGGEALVRNTTGFSNTANGVAALSSNTTGGNNTANGDFALLLNTTGGDNTAVGTIALENNATGSENIALGAAAGIGVTTANNVICIGTAGQNVDNSCYIGQIFGATSSGGTAVFIDLDGKLGTTTSSRRFKEEIKPMERTSEVLFALKPVTFRYKKGIDPQAIPQFGLVAEDVEAVNPNLVVRDKEGKVNTVRYEAVNAMLLNEFLKEHKTVQVLNSTVAKQEAAIVQQRKDFVAATAQQQNEIASLSATVKEQAAQIQKVNAQIELIKPAPQTVLNNQ